MSNLHFQPPSITVALGDTVEWTNRDIVPHTATARDSAWSSGTIEPGASWRTVVMSAGSHAYVCLVHPLMMGEVIAR
jgi:plastocyanin